MKEPAIEEQPRFPDLVAFLAQPAKAGSGISEDSPVDSRIGDVGLAVDVEPMHLRTGPFEAGEKVECDRDLLSRGTDVPADGELIREVAPKDSRPLPVVVPVRDPDPCAQRGLGGGSIAKHELRPT
jgi:hypothetical protein